jgi:molybdopterin/thiamine biosynthesis adenylyltransferase
MSAGRYHKQILLPGVGDAGQARLREAAVAVVGCGALGCAIADLLVRAGVGSVTLIDRDIVEWSNLQRQCLFDEADAREGLPKVVAAERRLRAVNSDVAIAPRCADLHSGTVDALLSGVQAIFDGTDNFPTRYLLNDFACRASVPFLYGGVVGWRGMAMAILPGLGPCLRCAFDEPPPLGSAPTCETAGVLGAAVSIVAGAQVGEGLKAMLGHGARVNTAMLDFDLFENARRRFTFSRRDDCPCCVQRRFEYLLAPPNAGAAICGQNAVHLPGGTSCDLARVAEALRPTFEVTLFPFMLRAALRESARPDDRAGAGAEGRAAAPATGHGGRGGLEFTLFPDGRMIVRGTSSLDAARAIRARYLGG